MDRRISDLDREIHLRPARPVIGLLLRVGQFQLPLVNPIDAQDDRPVWRVLIRGDQLRQATVAALVKIGGDSIALPGEKASKALGFRGYLNYPFCPSVTSEGQWSHHPIPYHAIRRTRKPSEPPSGLPRLSAVSPAPAITMRPSHCTARPASTASKIPGRSRST